MGEPVLEATRARVADLPRLADAHARAFVGRAWPAGFSTAFTAAIVTLQASVMLLPAVWAGEVYSLASATVVTMSARRTRWRRWAGMALVTVVVVVLELVVIGMACVLLLIAVRSPQWRLPAGAGAVLIALALIAVIIVAVWAVLALARRQHRGDTGVVRDIRRRHSDLTWWMLANLARGPKDPPGTGVSLMQKMLDAPQHAGGIIIAVAAAEPLVELYAAAGMTRVSKQSRVLYQLT